MNFSLHLLGFSSNKAICLPALKLLNLIKRSVYYKHCNFINIYFYAMNISFVKIFKEMEIHYNFKEKVYIKQ